MKLEEPIPQSPKGAKRPTLDNHVHGHHHEISDSKLAILFNFETWTVPLDGLRLCIHVVCLRCPTSPQCDDRDVKSCVNATGTLRNRLISKIQIYIKNRHVKAIVQVTDVHRIIYATHATHAVQAI